MDNCDSWQTNILVQKRKLYRWIVQVSLLKTKYCRTFFRVLRKLILAADVAVHVVIQINCDCSTFKQICEKEGESGARKTHKMEANFKHSVHLHC